MEKLEYKEAIKKYPWLKPRPMNPEYLNPNSELMIDSAPEGWEKAFLWDMIEEINNCLIENDCLDTYELLQVKEKFGSLRWYDNQKCTMDIIRKYEEISGRTCELCGAPGRVRDYRNFKWLMTLCDDCTAKILKK